ncbi:MAG: hypothetical protein IPM97_08800 [Bdellovibrionaceae bacterium]|nr:hypothetical protein [Pseudobdellovibrionaceae bacterium]
MILCIRRYYGPEFTAKKLRKWLKDIGVNIASTLSPEVHGRNGLLRVFQWQDEISTFDGGILLSTHGT